MVEALLVADRAGSPMRSVEAVVVTPGRGIAGDRYADGAGHWSGDRWDEVTLVEAETVEAVAHELGRVIEPAALRRNVVTRGVRLADLLGERFRLGDALLEGLRPCDPCRYLERLTGIDGLKTALAGRGGVRARVLEGGPIRIGDRLILDS